MTHRCVFGLAAQRSQLGILPFYWCELHKALFRLNKAGKQIMEIGE